MKLKIEKLGFEFELGEEFTVVVTVLIASAVWIAILVSVVNSTLKEAYRFGYAELVDNHYEWIIPGKAKKEVE